MKLKDKLIVNSYKTAAWLCATIPQPILYPLAAGGGELYYWLVRSHSRNADENIRVALGEKEINQRVRLVARRSFRNYAKYMTDLLRQPSISNADIEANVSTSPQDWEHISRGLALGKGLVFTSFHFSNWDAAACVFMAHGYKLASVAKDFEPPELNDLLQGARRGKGLHIFSLKDSLRGLITTLKNNGAVVLLVDSPLQNEGVIVDFLGGKVRMPTGPAILAQRTGAKIIMGYIVRQPGNNIYYGMWEPPLEWETTGDKEKDVQLITQKIADQIGEVVRRHPDQWYMFRRIFLTPAEVEAHLKSQSVRPERRKAASPVASEGISN